MAPYVVLESLRQFSSKANYLFRQVFETLNDFLDAPRDKKLFSRQLSTLASSLGLVLKASNSFASELERLSFPVSQSRQ